MVSSSIKEGIGRVRVNPYKKNGKVLVSKVANLRNLKEGILNSVNLIGGFNKIIEKDDEILLKPNFNTAGCSPRPNDYGWEEMFHFRRTRKGRTSKS